MARVALLIDVFRIGIPKREKPFLHVVSGAIAFLDLLLRLHLAISQTRPIGTCARPMKRSHEENASPRTESDCEQPARGRRSKRRPWFATTVPAARCPKSAAVTNPRPFPFPLCTVCIGHTIRRRKTASC